MAYIPPHKRLSNNNPSLTPEKYVQEFDKKLTIGSRSGLHETGDRHFSQRGNFLYAPGYITRWWLIGLLDGLCPPSVKLQPVPCEHSERKYGVKPLAFVHDHLLKDKNEMEQYSLKSLWSSIKEESLQDLQTAIQNVRRETEIEDFFLLKPSLVARVGKVLFHGGPSITPDAILKSVAADSSSRSKINKFFYTDIRGSYMGFVQSVVVPRLAVEFESEKERYCVFVQDKLRPKYKVCCKCAVSEDGSGLVIQKMELNLTSHLVIDISCLLKDLDLRLMLWTKSLSTGLTDEERQAIAELVNCAIIDPDVRGGLRWPLGKQTLLDRFSVDAVWHTKQTAFKNQKLRLTLRAADRFNFHTSKGQTTEEVILNMRGVTKQLLDSEAEGSVIAKMLQETLQMIWENFLSCDCSFSWTAKDLASPSLSFSL